MHIEQKSEDEQRLEYCRKYNIHHLFELLATKVLVERPANPFAYLREMLTRVEESEKHKNSYDATRIHFYDEETEQQEEQELEEQEQQQQNLEENKCIHEEAKQAEQLHEIDSSKSNKKNEIVANGSANNKKKELEKEYEIKKSSTPAKRRTSSTSPSRSLMKITLGMFGLDNAGKTTLLSALEGEINPNTLPTVGFTPLQFRSDNCDVCIFDLGGAANFRGIWTHYFHDCHGIIYVIDSASDAATVDLSLKVLQEMLAHPYLKEKPLLIFANKKDESASRGVNIVSPSYLHDVVASETPVRVMATCALVEDAELDAGMEWLLQTVMEQYAKLSHRVEVDTAAVKEEKARKRAERLLALVAEVEADMSRENNNTQR